MKVVSKLLLIIIVVTLVSASAMGNTRIRELGGDTVIEDTDGGTVWLYSDGTWINTTLLNTTLSAGGGILDGRIHTSNGGNYTASAANLQTAITATSSYGWVTVDADITTAATITMKKNVAVDFLGHELTASADIDVIKMKPGADLYNVFIDISGVGGYSDNHGGVLLDGADHYNVYLNPDGAYDTNIMNVQINSSSKRGTGIYFKCDTAGEYIYYVSVSNVMTMNLEYGVRMDVTANPAGAYINFNNVDIYRDSYSKYPIYVNRNPAASNSVEGCYFTNFLIQGDNLGNFPVVGVYCSSAGNVFQGRIDGIKSGSLGFYLTTNSFSNEMKVYFYDLDAGAWTWLDEGHDNLIQIGRVWPRYGYLQDGIMLLNRTITPTARKGLIYFNETDRTFWGYNGSDWVSLNESGGGAGDGFRTQEEIEDFVGAMVSGNTENYIAVTYNDGGGKLNFNVQNMFDNDLNQTNGPTFVSVTATDYLIGNLTYADYVAGNVDENFDIYSYENLTINADAQGNVWVFNGTTYAVSTNKNLSVYGGDGVEVHCTNITYGSLGGHISTDEGDLVVVPDSFLFRVFKILRLEPTDWPVGLTPSKGMLWSCDSNYSLLYYNGSGWVDLTTGGAAPASDGNDYFLNGTIQNSKGNSWTATGANIQLALNDLNTTGNGTVWLPAGDTITVSSSIHVWSNYTLDMQGATLIPDDDFDVVVTYPQSKLMNGKIDVSSMGAGFTHACIAPEAWNGALGQAWNGGAYYGNRTVIKNMDLVGNKDNQVGSGIYFYNDNIAQHHFFWMWIEDIQLLWFDTGINVSIPATGGSFNGNSFRGLHGIGCKYFIKLNDVNGDSGTPEIAGNTFIDIQYQPRSFTTDTHVIYGIGCDGNYFDNVQIWDWSSYGDTSYSINFTSATDDNMVIGLYGVSGSQTDDSGSDNVIIGGDDAYFIDLYAGNTLIQSDPGAPTFGFVTDKVGSAGLKIDTDYGKLHLNPYADQDVEVYAQSATGENRPFSIYGRQAGGGTLENINFKWDGTDGVIDTSTGGGNILMTPDGGYVNITGTLNVSTKIECSGGVDPPYVLFDRETIFSVFERIQNEVNPNIPYRWGGKALFYNADIDNMMIIDPETGDTREFVWKADFDALEQRVANLEVLVQQLVDGN